MESKVQELKQILQGDFLRCKCWRTSEVSPCLGNMWPSRLLTPSRRSRDAMPIQIRNSKKRSSSQERDDGPLVWFKPMVDPADSLCLGILAPTRQLQQLTVQSNLCSSIKGFSTLKISCTVAKVFHIENHFLPCKGFFTWKTRLDVANIRTRYTSGADVFRGDTLCPSGTMNTCTRPPEAGVVCISKYRYIIHILSLMQQAFRGGMFQSFENRGRREYWIPSFFYF